MSPSLSIEEIPVCLAIHLSLWLCTRPHLNISHSTFCFCGDWIQTQQPLLAENQLEINTMITFLLLLTIGNTLSRK